MKLRGNAMRFQLGPSSISNTHMGALLDGILLEAEDFDERV